MSSEHSFGVPLHRHTVLVVTILCVIFGGLWLCGMNPVALRRAREFHISEPVAYVMCTLWLADAQGAADGREAGNDDVLQLLEGEKVPDWRIHKFPAEHRNPQPYPCPTLCE